MKKTRIVILLLAVAALAFWGGMKFGGSGAHAHGDGPSTAEAEGGAMEQLYTCSMHPNVLLPKGNKCPICGMELIPVGEDDGLDDEPRTLRMSEASRALAEIETVAVERRSVAVEVRMVGKVDLDETRVSSITAWVPGRLERLFVDYTGVSVQQDDHLVVLYSPELLTAQQELIQAMRMQTERPDDRFSGLTARAAREKLSLWGLTADQIAEIEQRGEPSDRITIYAPSGGIVVKKNGLEGMYVKEGTEIYTIADMRHLWVKLDAYESDLNWLRLGQTVEFQTEAYAGEIFEGRIAFIDPVLDQRTRSVKVRVNVSNEDGRLKPGMFVRAHVHAEVAEGGQVRNPYLEGKWMCPMHPGEVAEQAGDCGQCEMPLVTAESLGYAGGITELELPLVIPTTAPLFTGRRAVVYVEVEGERPTYEGRVVSLGPRTENHYIVNHGLREGERVVVRGNFKIDSALQIRAKSSMMSMTGDEEVRTPAVALAVPVPFQVELGSAVAAYLRLAEQLAADEATLAGRAALDMRNALAKIDATGLRGEAAREWKKDLERLRQGLEQASNAGQDIARIRAGFLILSEALPDIFTRYRPALEGSVHQFYCPMAFDDRGASWFQQPALIANPYFGAMMLRCGEEIEAPTISKPAVEEMVVSEPLRMKLGVVVEACLRIAERLSADDPVGTELAALEVRKALSEVKSADMGDEAHQAWMKDARNLETGVNQIVDAEREIEAQRRGLLILSKTLPAVFARYRPIVDGKIHQFHCPMAFDNRGASWFQKAEQIANPYFGAMMLRCGTEIEGP